MLSATCGVPVMVTASLKVAVAVTTSVALSQPPALAPEALRIRLLTVAAVLSTKKLALSPTAAELKVALLPTVSLMVPAFRLSALPSMLMPLASFWADVMV